MSFLEAIKEKKYNLHSCETVVTTVDGAMFKEVMDGQKFRKIQTLSVLSPGYVVDTKPDLQIAHILPGLYMGSQDVAADENILKLHSITHILSLGVKTVQFSHISYNYVDILDLPETDIISVAELCFSYINEVRRGDGSVFVHCNAGVSRSAAVIIAYLMKFSHLSFDQAYQFLKEKREAIRPNDGFKEQLLEYEKFLRAL